MQVTLQWKSSHNCHSWYEKLIRMPLKERNLFVCINSIILTTRRNTEKNEFFKICTIRFVCPGQANFQGKSNTSKSLTNERKRRKVSIWKMPRDSFHSYFNML